MNKGFWGLFVLLFLSEAAFQLLPDDELQFDIELEVQQCQIVIVAAMGYMAHSFENTFRKGAMFLVLLWGLLIVLTDRLIDAPPLWLGVATGAIFIGWMIYANWRTKRIQGFPEARHVFGDDSMAPGNGKGR